MTTPTSPWFRYVALGDSFTEGIGDPEPTSPGGFRGWADRVAEVLAAQTDRFEYANLAVRGKVIRQVLQKQLDAALALEPDLVTLCAGGNDVIRFGSDPDKIATLFELGVKKLVKEGRTIVIFTGINVGFAPVFRPVRGKIAIYNENLRGIAQKYDCLVADMWTLREIQDPRMWCDDRLHLNTLGHHTVTRMVLQTLNVQNSLQPLKPEPAQPQSWRQARVADLRWAGTHFAPWVVRRIRGRSSGDLISAKRPHAGPVFPTDQAR